MKNFKSLFLVLLFIFVLQFKTTFAGEGVPVCEKVHNADIILEVELIGKTDYLEQLKNLTHSQLVMEFYKIGPEKRWLESQKVLSTGVISKIFRSSEDLKIGQIYPADRMATNVNLQGVVEHSRREPFKMIIFLKKIKQKYVEVGGAEEGWPQDDEACTWNPKYSYCPNYLEYVEAVSECANHWYQVKFMQILHRIFGTEIGNRYLH